MYCIFINYLIMSSKDQRAEYILYNLDVEEFLFI